QIGDAQVALTPVDQRAEAEPHRREEKDRVDEARDHRAAPGALVGDELRLDGATSAGQGGDHQSISLRPVSLRNTSSSVERRTRTCSGWTPRSCKPRWVDAASLV